MVEKYKKKCSEAKRTALLQEAETGPEPRRTGAGKVPRAEARSGEMSGGAGKALVDTNVKDVG